MKLKKPVEKILLDVKFFREKNRSSLSVEDLDILDRLIVFLENPETVRETTDGKAKFLDFLPDLIKFILNPEIWKIIEDLLGSFKD